jgi:hypothetical protein
MAPLICAAVSLLLVLAGSPALGDDDPEWCWQPGAEQLWTAVVGNSLTVYHDGAGYNCGYDSLVVQASLEDFSITIRELEYPEGGYLACLCCYNFETEVGDLAPGTYAIEVIWSDSTWTTSVLIPNVGQDLEAGPITGFASACLDHNPHDDTPATPETWGRVKVRFR